MIVSAGFTALLDAELAIGPAQVPRQLKCHADLPGDEVVIISEPCEWQRPRSLESLALRRDGQDLGTGCADLMVHVG